MRHTEKYVDRHDTYSMEYPITVDTTYASVRIETSTYWENGEYDPGIAVQVDHVSKVGALNFLDGVKGLIDERAIALARTLVDRHFD